MSRRVVEHRLAQMAQALFGGQSDAERHLRRALQLVDEQGGNALLALQRLAIENDAAAVGARIELEGQGEQQPRRFEDAALLPLGRVAGIGGEALAAPARIEIEREQVGILDHRHRVLDTGRDPQGTRRRHDGRAVRHGDADDSRARDSDLPPGMGVRHDARRREQVLQLGAHRPRSVRAEQVRRERADGWACSHWRDRDRV